MGARKRRRILGAAAGAAVVAALLGGWVSAASSVPVAGPAPGPITPTVKPAAVPVLGPLTLGTFPSTWGGTKALELCEDWAELRGEYVARVKTDTRFELEQWFSSAAWEPAFNDSGPLWVNPGYGAITIAFGEVSTSASAGLAAARLLDQACAAAD